MIDTRRFRLRLPKDLSPAELAITAPGSLVNPRELMYGGLAGYEPETLACFLACLTMTTEGDVFDIGANVGVFSWLAAAAGRPVVAFEPAPDTAACAIQIAKDNALAMRVEQIALGDRDGTATFHLSTQSDLSNSLRAGYRTAKGTLTIPVETLAGYCARTGARPSVLKIDTETTEDEVLRGARSYLELARPWIICEVLGGAHDQQLAAELEPLGYHWYQITNEPELVRRREIFGDRGHAYRNWLFAPSEPSATMWAELARWKKALAACQPRQRRTLLDSPGLSFHQCVTKKTAWRPADHPKLEVSPRGDLIALRSTLVAGEHVHFIRAMPDLGKPAGDDAMAITAGTRYELVVDVEGEQPTMPGMFLYALLYDAKAQIQQERVWLKPGANTLPVIGHEGARSLRIMFRIAGPGQAVISPVRCYRIDET